MIICFIIMLILKLPYAVLISVIVGITNMIPYFGPYIGGVIGGVIIVIASPIKLIIFVIMIVCIQQVDGLLIGPRIIGSTTGLKPVWVVFSITVGGALFGVIGMFLGVPVFAVLSYLLNITVQHFLEKEKSPCSLMTRPMTSRLFLVLRILTTSSREFLNLTTL